MTSTTAWASNSTTRNSMFKLQQRIRPSHSPHNSVVKLFAEPMCVEKPATHSPWSSLTKPPQPALSAPPNHDPSVLSFFQPKGGLSQQILLLIFRIGFLGECTQYMYSNTWFIISFDRLWFTLFPLKTTIFRFIHIYHTAKEKVIFQGGFSLGTATIGFPIAIDPILEISHPKILIWNAHT